ncbi:MAG: DUF72 domain-containing protein [Gemmatimonadetes bacterium]|nr:DUF72 domain-containing protein [Gemmatimonadota bacterium]
MNRSLRFGCQGWNYAAWVGPFYPPRTRAADFLAVYARAFNTVEVDSTFYATPAVQTVRSWATRVPEGFQFALKLPQEITHEHRLRRCESQVERFFDVARELGPKLGPVLVQLGPDFGPVELPALTGFLPLLPNDLRIAVEFRQRGWINDGVIALLGEHRVALALADARFIPRSVVLKLAERPTADFAYLRWMGPDRQIVDYSRVQHDRTKELDQWRAAIPVIAKRVKTVFGYVNNHFSGHAPENVRWLQRQLGQVAVDPAQLGDQLQLF